MTRSRSLKSTVTSSAVLPHTRAARHGPTSTLQHQTAEAMKAMAVHDGSLFEETYNLLNAWLSIVPGTARTIFDASRCSKPTSRT